MPPSPATRRRPLTEDDRRTWAHYAQNVAPLSGLTPPPVPEIAQQAEGIRPAPPPPEPARPKPQLLNTLEVGAAPSGIDRATWQKFRAGKLAPARTLDLHGHTAQRAYAELHAFLAAAVAQRLRCVEVITGRGRGESGVIRRETPLWLNGPTLRPMVLAATHPHPANPGAVRLLLRRVR